MFTAFSVYLSKGYSYTWLIVHCFFKPLLISPGPTVDLTAYWQWCSRSRRNKSWRIVPSADVITIRTCCARNRRTTQCGAPALRRNPKCRLWKWGSCPERRADLRSFCWCVSLESVSW